MLNTQKYNLGKYNIAGGAASASGTVVAHSEMYGEPYVIYHASGSSHTIGKMEAAMPTRIVPITGNTIEATSDMEAQYYKRVEAIGTSARCSLRHDGANCRRIWCGCVEPARTGAETRTGINY